MSDHWSPEEKKAARVIFDRASARARAEVIERHRSKKISTIEELWAYELEIREWRRDFQMTFQYTYSALDACFGLALRRGWLTSNDLRGLREERVARIKAIANLK
jgi:hypothetical protein